MKLNRTGSNWTELERNKINENWDIIEGSHNKLEDEFDDVVGKITDEVVGHLIDSARLDWREPVDTVGDLPTNAEVGETRMVREADPDGVSYVYRYDGEKWEEIQEIDVTLVNEVDSRLNKRFDDLNDSLNLKKANAQVILDIPTYHTEEDDHVVHPSVLQFSTKKYGYNYIMAYTPYSESRDRFENPSIVVSDDRWNWHVPSGLINPVIKQPSTGFHYSDPLLIDNGAELEMWYRLTDKNNSRSQILMVKTTDLINWTQPVIIWDYEQYSNAYVSPTGLKDDGVYKIWYKNTANIRTEDYVLVTSSDLINWSDAVETSFDFGEYEKENFVNWHIEIKAIDGKFVCIANAVSKDDEYSLFYFDSIDGVNFGNVKKIMEPSLAGFDNFRIYKASVIKEGVWYYVYYSAFSRDYGCHIGLTKAAGALVFSGATQADKTYYEKRLFTTNAIQSERDFINILDDLRISDKNIRLVKTGVSGAIIEASNNRDTLMVKTETTNKTGYIDVAGVYLNSEENDSIQGVHMNTGATYLDKQSKGLSIHPHGTYKQRYARFLQFGVNLATQNLTIYEGVDQVVDLENSVYGFKVNFQNMPNGYSPFAFIAQRNPEGVSTGNTSINYLYVREIGHTHVIVGMKSESRATQHTQLDDIEIGSIRVVIIY